MEILDFIKDLRESFYGSVHVYKNGSCFKLADLLRKMYGGTVVEIHGHCSLFLDNKLYDIEGQHEAPENCLERYSDFNISYYGNELARYDLVLDGEVDLPYTEIQVKTLIVHESQMLRFGHDLELVGIMVNQALRVNSPETLTFNRLLTEEEKERYSNRSVEVVEHEGEYLTFVIGGE
jgi:hypothetical protein